METNKTDAEQLNLFPTKRPPLRLVSIEVEKGTGDPYESKGKFLSRAQFLYCLRMEKRRSDRSKSPLSIILFSIHWDIKSRDRILREFFQYIHGATRETDIKGVINENLMGLILPDTDKAGSQNCIRKIVQGDGHFPFSIVSATYPDEIFQKLLNEAEIQPDLFPINLDEDIKTLGAQLLFKRAVDILGSLLGLIIFSPLFLLISIAIKINSSGPVIFEQIRFGKNGEKFSFLKFRSMYVNNDDTIHRKYISNLIEGNLDQINQGEGKRPLFKMKADPRVTGVGRFIRKTSLDELPQFWNVLRGEMSLVGPRPPLVYEIEKYEPWHLRRILEMKPGITGLWQVSGRSTISFAEMVRIDLRYVRNWSIWMDIKILLKTIIEVIRPTGAA